MNIIGCLELVLYGIRGLTEQHYRKEKTALYCISKTFLRLVAGLTLGLNLSLVAGVEDRLALPVAHLGAALLEECVFDRSVDRVVSCTTLGASVAIVTSDSHSYQDYQQQQQT